MTWCHQDNAEEVWLPHDSALNIIKMDFCHAVRADGSKRFKCTLSWWLAVDCVCFVTNRPFKIFVTLMPRSQHIDETHRFTTTGSATWCFCSKFQPVFKVKVWCFKARIDRGKPDLPFGSKHKHNILFVVHYFIVIDHEKQTWTLVRKGHL